MTLISCSRYPLPPLSLSLSLSSLPVSERGKGLVMVGFVYILDYQYVKTLTSFCVVRYPVFEQEEGLVVVWFVCVK